jgi:hypothetical protein
LKQSTQDNFARLVPQSFDSVSTTGRATLAKI